MGNLGNLNVVTVKNYVTPGGRGTPLRVIRLAPIDRDRRRARSEAWHIVHGHAHAPASTPTPTLPRAPTIVDYCTPTAMHPAEHPIRQVFATLAILAVIVMLCACWAVR